MGKGRLRACRDNIFTLNAVFPPEKQGKGRQWVTNSNLLKAVVCPLLFPVRTPGGGGGVKSRIRPPCPQRVVTGD